jgi:hypothetical protein
MTKRKRENKPAGDRPAAYVTRETGAAELAISPQTWDRWVDAGILPPCAPGFPVDSPRWRWADVDNKLAGRKASVSIVSEYLAGVEKLRGPKKESGREAA